MWYRGAMSFGDSEGTIQCTYAIIYDKDGNRIFALQRKKWEERLETKSLAWLQESFDNGHYQYPNGFGSMVYTGAGQEGIFYWDDGNIYTGNTTTGYLTIDFPLVVAKEYSTERLVPVRLLPEAVAFIKKALANGQKKTWVYNVYNNNNGEKGELVETYYYAEALKHATGINHEQWLRDNKDGRIVTDKYIIESAQVPDPRFEKVRNRINESETFYVKPAAFNWHPINVNVKSERLKKAKADLDRAQALLVAAGVATAI